MAVPCNGNPKHSGRDGEIMPQLRFRSTDATVVLVGGVFMAADATSLRTMLFPLRLVDGQSDPFDLPSPGSYRYEFEIKAGPTFSLSLETVPDLAAVPCFAGPFDPNDPTLGGAAKVGRKSSFTV
jgi:hypothetical protein